MSEVTDGTKRIGAFAGLFLIGAETFLVSPLLPAMADDLSVTASAAAVTVTAYVATYAIVSPFMGAVADRIGRRIPLIIGMTLFCVANVLCAIGVDLSTVVIGRGIGGLGAALAGPSIWALLADSVRPEAVSRVMGSGMAVFSAGQVIGIPVGAGITTLAGWRWAFGVLALCSVATVIVIAIQVRPAPTGATHSTLRSGLAVVADRRILPILVTTVATQLFSLGAYAYVGEVLSIGFGWQQATLGVIGVLVGLGSMAGSLLNGRFIGAGRGGPARLTGWVVVMLAAVLVFANVTAAPVAVLALAVWFVGSGAFVTEQQTSLAVAAGPRRAAASAWNTSAMHAGTAVGVSAIGAITPLTHGITVVTVIAGVFAVLSTIPIVVAQERITREKVPA